VAVWPEAKESPLPTKAQDRAAKTKKLQRYYLQRQANLHERAYHKCPILLSDPPSISSSPSRHCAIQHEVKF